MVASGYSSASGTAPGSTPPIGSDKESVRALDTIKKLFGPNAEFGTPEEADTNLGPDSDTYYVVPEWYAEAVGTVADSYTSRNTERDRAAIIARFIDHRSMKEITESLGPMAMS